MTDSAYIIGMMGCKEFAKTIKANGLTTDESFTLKSTKDTEKQSFFPQSLAVKTRTRDYT